MDPFDKPHWARFQVNVWVCFRNKEPVRWAEHTPGSTAFLDLSLGPDGWDDEDYDHDPPLFGDEDELFREAARQYNYVCERDDAQKEVVVAACKGRLKAHLDPKSGAEFFERDEVLKIWPEKAVVVGSEAESPESPEPLKQPRRGRRAAYDWEAFHLEVTRIASTPDGLPEVQADLENSMAEWCGKKWGKEPSESTIRHQVSKVYKACRKVGIT